MHAEVRADAARDGHLAAAALTSNLPQQRCLYALAARLAGDWRVR